MDRRIVIITLLTVFVAIVFYPVGCHYQWQSETEKYVAQLKAQGEIMDAVKLSPPPLSPDRDGTDLFQQAIAQMDFEGSSNSIGGMYAVAPGKAMIRWQQLDIRDQDSTNSWADMPASVARNTNALEKLQQIIDRPAFDFHINYGTKIFSGDFSILSLSESKKAVLLLNTAAICDLHNGHTAEAVTNNRAMLALVQAMGDERILISELVRIAMGQIALSTTWEVLQSTKLTDPQLASLQQSWMGLDFVHSGENVLVGERVVGDISLRKLRNSPNSVASASGLAFFDTDQFQGKIKAYLWRTWWSYPDELNYLKGFQIGLNTMRKLETNEAFFPALSEETNQLAKLSTQSDLPFGIEGDFRALFSDSFDLLSSTTKIVMRMETAKKLAITAIALKRYELQHGEWPASLTNLTPEFLPTVPIDPVDGKPLRYRKNADGSFLLYSIGSDGHDDGGNPDSRNTGRRWYYWEDVSDYDWVWPQPASAKEVQTYYSHLTN